MFMASCSTSFLSQTPHLNRGFPCSYGTKASPTPGEEPDALHGDAQYHGEVDQKLVEEVMWAVGPVFQEVRQETSALLLEISSDAQMVELLMRR